MPITFEDAARTILAEELERLRRTIIDHHFAAGQKASGKTAASIHAVVNESEGTLYGRAAFDELEKGRKPGPAPKDFYKVILQWMRDKGIKGTPIPYTTDRPHKYTPQERGDRTLAYFIAKKIQKDGTRLFRAGGRTDIYSNAIPQAKRRILKRIKKIIEVEVRNIHLNKTGKR